MVSRLRSMLERFADALSCIDQCFIADQLLEQLPTASQVGKTTIGGIDPNKARMRAIVEALIALSASPNGFTAAAVAARVCARTEQSPSQYGPRRAAYDPPRQGYRPPHRSHPRYEPLPTGLRAMTALLVLGDKAIKPLLAGTRPLRPARGAHTTQNRSINTTLPSTTPCEPSSMNSGSPPDHRQSFCRASPRSA
jgi:hypothetical protein